MTNINYPESPWHSILLGGPHQQQGMMGNLPAMLATPAVVPPPRPSGQQTRQFNEPVQSPLLGPVDSGTGSVVENTEPYDAAWGHMSEDMLAGQIQEASKEDDTSPVKPGEPEQNAFMKWWSSDHGKVQRMGFFDALSQIGAGLAGIGPGSNDYSSLERGLRLASGSYERASMRFHSRQFSDRIDSQIKAELAKGDKADQNKLNQLYMAQRDPKSFIRGQMVNGGMGPFERAQVSLWLAREKSGLMSQAMHRDLKAARVWLNKIPAADVAALRSTGGQEGMSSWGRMLMKYGVLDTQVAGFLTALAAAGDLGPSYLEMPNEELARIFAEMSEEQTLSGASEDVTSATDAVVVATRVRGMLKDKERGGPGKELDMQNLSAVTGGDL